MIEVNLLPGGARKKTSSAAARSSVDFATLVTSITSKLGNPYVMVAIVLAVIGVGAFGWMYLKGEKDRTVAESRLEKGQHDSLTYASVSKARVRLEAKRDTLLRQVNLIRSIDEDRYIWPHILDEVSRALPPYTWLTFLQFAGPPSASNNVVAAPKPPARDPAAKVSMVTLYGPGVDSVEDAAPKTKGDTTKQPGTWYKPKDGKITVPSTMVLKMINLGWSTSPTTIPKDEILFRITGRTVDIQALTRFMNDLSLSPFIGAVDIEPVTPGSDQGKETFQFTLSLKYRRPDSTALHRLPLVVTGR